MSARPRVGSGAIAQKLILFAAAFVGISLMLQPAAAAIRHHPHHRRAHIAAYSYTYPSEDAALIVDGETGHTLYARNAEALRYPASLTKLMTLYLLFDALKKGTVTMQTPMPVSAHAAGQAPVKLYMHPGVDTISVEQAIKAIVVLSANDVAVVIAEELGGTEGRFAEMMNTEAHKLGMMHTHYADASGLPNRGQLTTAGDLAIIARRISYDFPKYYHFFATPTFTWKGHKWFNHDNLLKSYPGADGMKTGFTDWSGFNLVTSVTRGNMRLIGVVMGGRTAHLRDIEMAKLLNEQFARIKAAPTLVAHNDLPWKAFGAAPKTMIAGFELPVPNTAPEPRPRAMIAAAAPTLRTAVNDKAAHANARTSPIGQADSLASLIAPKPRPQTQLASYTPRRAAALAALQSQAGPRSASLATTDARLHDWTIQIGAYKNPAIARHQLAAYAKKSTDILGQAERIVDPFKGADGQTMFRARFGPFAQRQARKVCERLTERGQTCFAAVAAR